jgi:hypothetical protein
MLPLTELAEKSGVTPVLLDKSITSGDIEDQISSLLSALMKPYGVLEMRCDEHNAHLRYRLDRTLWSRLDWGTS